MDVKNKILLINFLVLFSFIYSASVSPILGLRFNDILGSDTLGNPSQSLGLKMEVSDGIFSGFDVSDGDFRIFVQQSFATFGIGTNGEDEPQFTVGGNYNVLDNLSVSLDYIINQLTDDNANPGNPYSDELRIGLTVIF